MYALFCDARGQTPRNEGTDPYDTYNKDEDWGDRPLKKINLRIKRAVSLSIEIKHFILYNARTFKED